MTNDLPSQWSTVPQETWLDPEVGPSEILARYRGSKT